ncbi:MAG: hypothetical protein NC117_02750 [Pseudoflavonifractor sp.]|nr:hypothetical protein [Pseudoflavonifractor sp.]
MRLIQLLTSFLWFALGAALGCISTCHEMTVCNDGMGRDTVIREVYHDTIPYHEPEPGDSVVVRHEVATLPRVTDGELSQSCGLPTDTLTATVQTSDGDSARVVVPITQTTYQDSTYTAYVSGYRARLDSLFVYPRREVVTIRKSPRRWSVGVQAGYGYTPKGFQPYIGVGISCKLWEF